MTITVDTLKTTKLSNIVSEAYGGHTCVVGSMWF